jgi:hypothetical protein
MGHAGSLEFASAIAAPILNLNFRVLLLIFVDFWKPPLSILRIVASVIRG